MNNGWKGGKQKKCVNLNSLHFIAKLVGQIHAPSNDLFVEARGDQIVHRMVGNPRGRTHQPMVAFARASGNSGLPCAIQIVDGNVPTVQRDGQQIALLANANPVGRTVQTNGRNWASHIA
jgi:hypothetical protein